MLDNYILTNYTQLKGIHACSRDYRMLFVQINIQYLLL